MKRPLLIGYAAVLLFFSLLGILAWHFLPRPWSLQRFLHGGNYRIYTVGEKFHGFPDLKTAEGGGFHLADHPHRALLVSYFATW